MEPQLRLWQAAGELMSVIDNAGLLQTVAVSQYTTYVQKGGPSPASSGRRMGPRQTDGGRRSATRICRRGGPPMTSGLRSAR
jgi:hypothetical protein